MKHFTFQPVGFDRFDPKPHQPKVGETVRIGKAPSVGAAPKPFAYVYSVADERFCGMVLRASLQPVNKKAA